MNNNKLFGRTHEQIAGDKGFIYTKGSVDVNTYFDSNGDMISNPIADQNRKLSAKEFLNLRDSFRRNSNLIDLHPIYLEKSGLIIDGRHRILVAKDLQMVTYPSITITHADGSDLYEEEKFELFNIENISRNLTTIDKGILAIKLLNKILAKELYPNKFKDKKEIEVRIFACEINHISIESFRRILNIWNHDKTILYTLTEYPFLKYLKLDGLLTRQLAEISRDLKMRLDAADVHLADLTDEMKTIKPKFRGYITNEESVDFIFYRDKTTRYFHRYAEKYHNSTPKSKLEKKMMQQIKSQNKSITNLTNHIEKMDGSFDINSEIEASIGKKPRRHYK